MALTDYTRLLEPQVQPEVVVLLVQVGITMLYAKETGAEKLDIIVGEVRVTRVWTK